MNNLKEKRRKMEKGKSFNPFSHSISIYMYVRRIVIRVLVFMRVREKRDGFLCVYYMNEIKVVVLVSNSHNKFTVGSEKYVWYF